jgi:CheY-like chemotaxis protein
MTKKLLVMDENTTIQRVVKLAFKQEAIQVITVPRGQDAFEQIERDLPDIVLADNGGEVAAFMKPRPPLSRIPVVLLQGAFDEAVEGGGDAQGCDGVLMKPLQPQAMIDLVKSLLHKHPSAFPGKPAVSKSAAVDPASGAASLKSAAAGKVAVPDAELELDRYFDGLAAAFSSAEGGHASPLLDAGWTNPILPPDIGAAAPAPPHRTVRRAVDPAGDEEITNEAFVELITQRVLDRLGERVTRATATELVSRLSKWLLVDEVERSRA